MSLWYSMPPSQIGQHMTARDMLEYEVADSLGMIPDWRELRQLLLAVAGVDSEDTDSDGQQDMTTLYEQRKALYGRQGR